MVTTTDNGDGTYTHSYSHETRNGIVDRLLYSSLVEIGGPIRRRQPRYRRAWQWVCQMVRWR